MSEVLFREVKEETKALNSKEVTKTLDIHKKLSLQSFPRALAKAYQKKFTGAIVVKALQITKIIYFENGSVIFASSNDRNDRLGEMLVRRGIISIPDFLEASSLVVPGKRFGSILVEKKLLSPEQLVWAVKEQVKEIIFSLFGELFVSYSFEPNKKLGDEVITLNINTPELIREGIISMDRISWALSDLEDIGEKIFLEKSPEEILNLLSLSKIEQEVLYLLKDGLYLKDIFRERPVSIHASLLKFLWALFVLGFVGIEKKGEESSIDGLELDVTMEDLKI